MDTVGDNVLKIKTFDLNTLVSGASIVISAKRGSGKSILIRHLMYHYHNVLHFPAGIVCSKSERVDPFYKNFFPDIFIYDDCEKAFNKILTRQTKIKTMNDKIKREHLDHPLIDGRLLLVLDDVLASAKVWSKSETMKEIMYNGRHYDITLIIAVQDTMALTPDVRNNMDYVFLFNNDIYVEVEKLWKYYAGIFPKVRMFADVLNQVTEDYGVLVIIRRGVNSNNLLDKIARFKATYNLPKFMFGSDKTVKYYKTHYDKDWLNKENMLKEKYNMIGRNSNHTMVKFG